MVGGAFTAKARRRLLDEHTQARVRLIDAEPKDAARHEAELDRLEHQYDAGLPLLSVSCCPFDRLPVKRPFDHLGLDGLWWHPDRPRPEGPDVCRHFVAATGALTLGAGEAPPHPVFAAAAAPFVSPSLLEHDGVVAVIATRPIEPTHAAHLVTYFAEDPSAIAAAMRPPEIGRRVRHYLDAEGRPAWRGLDEGVDFDLDVWVERGKLRFCRQLDPIARLFSEGTKSPYAAAEPEARRPVRWG
ncbi:MAG: hypothetical protein RMA76_12375 [Deltaproteobacteria bacterium]